MSSEGTVRLVAFNGKLYYPNATIDEENRQFYGENDVAILYQYHEQGRDLHRCRRISWPLTEECPDWLRSCLFDARETGLIPPNCKAVELPSGETFAID
jgi:hypothetical protein